MPEAIEKEPDHFIHTKKSMEPTTFLFLQFFRYLMVTLDLTTIFKRALNISAYFSVIAPTLNFDLKKESSQSEV